MSLIFVSCEKCGEATEDRNILMTCAHFSWTCPACGYENPPWRKRTAHIEPEPEEEKPLVLGKTTRLL